MRNLFQPKSTDFFYDLHIRKKITKINYIRLKFISLFSLVYFTINFFINSYSHFISKTDSSNFFLYSIPYSIAFFVNIAVQVILKKPNLAFSQKIQPHLVMSYFLFMMLLSTIISILDLFFYNHLIVFLSYFILCTAILILPLKNTFFPITVSFFSLLISLFLKNNWTLSNEFNLSLLLILSIIILGLSYYNYGTIYTGLLQHHLLVLEQEKSKLLTEQLRIVAHTDELTKLANRHGYYEYIEKIKHQLPLRLTTMILDIDFFKKYNDFYGHHMGDVALQKVAIALHEVCADKDRYSVRWGGEEFLILLQNHTDDEIQQVYNQFINIVNELIIEHEASPISNILTFSIGSNTQIISSIQDIEKSLRLADEAQYQIKRSTKNNALFLKDGKIEESKVLF